MFLVLSPSPNLALEDETAKKLEWAFSGEARSRPEGRNNQDLDGNADDFSRRSCTNSPWTNREGGGRTPRGLRSDSIPPGILARRSERKWT